MTLAIHELPKPVIAAINGPAVGIGATMTLAMDIRMASTKARIGFVFGRLGIVPEAASTWFLPRIVGLQQALEWVYSAEILTAEQALEGRLLRSVHEPDELLPAALELARSFVVRRSPVALGLAKRLLYRNSSVDHPIEAHRADSLAMWHASIGDGKEGVAAFLEKRDPEFTGQGERASPRSTDLVRVSLCETFTRQDVSGGPGTAHGEVCRPCQNYPPRLRRCGRPQRVSSSAGAPASRTPSTTSSGC